MAPNPGARQAEGERFPKILVVAAGPIESASGTGITLRNLFASWPAGRIAQVHLVAQEDNLVSEVVGYHYEPHNAPVDFLFRRLLARKNGRNGSALPASIGAVAISKNASFKSSVHATMRAAADMSYTHYPETLDSFVSRFAPDVVYSLLGSVRVMKLACHVSDVAQVPLVPHFMDDWPSTLYVSGEAFGVGRRSANRWVNESLARSNVGLAISEDMASEYRRRYHKEFKPFGNAVSLEDFPACLCTEVSGPRNEPTNFTYVGGLHLGRWQSLLEVAEAIESTAPRTRLEIYAPASEVINFAAKFEHLSMTKVVGSLTPTQVPAALCKADVLVHVESFEPEYKQYTRFSLSTKIPQYLASGKPIVGFGPSGLASINHILKTGGGEVVTERNSDGLGATLTRLSSSPELRKSLGDAGRRYAEIFHERGAVTNSLANYLKQGVATPD